MGSFTCPIQFCLSALASAEKFSRQIASLPHVLSPTSTRTGSKPRIHPFPLLPQQKLTRTRPVYMERTPLKVGVVEGFTTLCGSVKASQPLHFLVSSPQAHLHRNEFFSLHFTDFFFPPSIPTLLPASLSTAKIHPPAWWNPGLGPFPEALPLSSMETLAEALKSVSRFLSLLPPPAHTHPHAPGSTSHS